MQTCETVQRRFWGNIVTETWLTAYRCFWEIVSSKPGTLNSDVLGEMLSRKFGTRQRDV